MPKYFVDSWYFVAQIDKLDGDHRQVLAVTSRLRMADLYTHDAVLGEVLTYFADAGEKNRVAAASAARTAFRTMTVLSAARDLFLVALARYEKRGDKQYSLADCMSMVVMEQLGITHVLTNDHHFRQEGFTVINE